MTNPRSPPLTQLLTLLALIVALVLALTLNSAIYRIGWSCEIHETPQESLQEQYRKQQRRLS